MNIETDLEFNQAATNRMAQLADKLAEFGLPKNELALFLVRLLFCFFAEDTGIFPQHSFRNYVAATPRASSHLSSRITQLFAVLNTPETARASDLSAELQFFPYINNGLFSNILSNIHYDSETLDIILFCCDFDWSKISLSVFGSMFQSIMNQEKRRKAGAHYTSEENILKVIKPLVFDLLYDEFKKAKSSTKNMIAFHNKLSNLRFLDPAAGCGNFLIVAYQKLRELEFLVLDYFINTDEPLFDSKDTFTSKVHLFQFYGIEYEKFPCEIARVSLSLMKYILDQILFKKFNINHLPKKDYPNIIHGNALHINWLHLANGHLDFIIGNPPYVGAMYLNNQQRADMKMTLGHIPGFGELDYITAWFYKAKEVMLENPNVSAAFVSTSSLCQGQTVLTFWKSFLKDNNIFINFAYTQFKWSNKARNNAAVHCIIIGFSRTKQKKNFIIDPLGNRSVVPNITPYLTPGKTSFIRSRKKPIGFKKNMLFGSMPRDGGHLIFTEIEKNIVSDEYPISSLWFRKYIGAREFIHNTYRWVLWLTNVSPHDIALVPPIADRVAKVRDFRLRSKANATQRFATTPHLFCQIAQPSFGHFLAVPRVSSLYRDYLPIGFVSSNTIASDALLIVPLATPVDFALIVSSAHMAWMRAVAGRLELDYRYSRDIVYNNFPLPPLDLETDASLTATAHQILNVRSHFPDLTYANLYDHATMPTELRDAHLANDHAVWKAYGKSWRFGDDADCVATLMRMYDEQDQSCD